MGGAAAVGGVLGIVSSAIQTAISIREAKKQRAFQEKMYRHRYRYTMEDMEKAGLNPMLAAKLGGGSAPPGARGEAASAADASRIASSVSSASLQTQQKKLLAQQMITETEKQKDSRDMRHRRGFENAKTVAETSNIEVNNALLKATVPGAELEKKMDESGFGAATRALKRIIPGLNSARGLAR